MQGQVGDQHDGPRPDRRRLDGMIQVGMLVALIIVPIAVWQRLEDAGYDLLTWLERTPVVGSVAAPVIRELGWFYSLPAGGLSYSGWGYLALLWIIASLVLTMARYRRTAAALLILSLALSWVFWLVVRGG